ncbi:AAA family ATPase [Sphingomonas sp.]|uniref:AAA family ATPase n=1 Tax=Sphingomonas sp. TaxID=28214 RepID=UPI0035C83E71
MATKFKDAEIRAARDAAKRAIDAQLEAEDATRSSPPPSSPWAANDAGPPSKRPTLLLTRAYARMRAAQAVASTAPDERFGIDGWHPWSGLSPHFGPAKVGKTWAISGIVTVMAAIDTASTAAPTAWNTFEVMRRGVTFWYSGEETEDRVSRRLRKLFMRMGYRDEDLALVMSRIVSIAPISMSKAEFPSLNPFLMEYRRDGEKMDWLPTATHEWLWDSIEAWNAEVKADGGPAEDMVVNLVIDSVTSCSGFNSVEDVGIANMLFHLNQKGDRNEVAIIAIAHTPKEVRYAWDDPDADILSRLKGSGAWSALSRLIVEWAKPRPQEAMRAGSDKMRPWFEAMPLFNRGIAKSKRDLGDCLVARCDGNVAFSRGKIWLKRDDDGFYTDYTAVMRGEPRNYEDWLAAGGDPTTGQIGGTSTPPIDTRKAARFLIVTTLRKLIAEHREADNYREIPHDKRKAVTKKELVERLMFLKAEGKTPVLGLAPANGGIDFNEGAKRPFGITKDLETLMDQGRIVKVTGGYDVGTMSGGGVHPDDVAEVGEEDR